MKKTHFLISFSLFLLYTPLTFSASFDCASAKTFVEKAVCSDDQLSTLDDQLSESYMVALTSVADEKKLKAEQIAWLKNVRNKCVDNDCLEKAYLTRLLALNKIADEKTVEKVADTTVEKKADKSLPKEITDFLARVEGCDHWAGEEGYDEERKKEIKKAIKRLKCKKLDKETKKLQQKYKNDPEILKTISHDK
jgi:uncharacterized protein